MTQFVVDASVALKWLVPEEHAEQALTLNSPANNLAAPDLLFVEMANVVWKKCRRGEISSDEAERLVAVAMRAPVRTLDSASLLPAAMRLALAHNCTVYDSLYVALALREQCPLVTADRRLFNAIAPAFPENVTWVEEL